jgi:acetyl esterase/lipase
MTQTPAEARIRALFPAVRFMQSYMPLRLAQWGNRQLTRRARVPGGVTRQAVSADGVACDWLIPRDSPSDRVLLYLHGGGFVYGQTALHIQMVAHLCQRMGVRALLVDYRLSPQHPYPAPLEDCITAYRWLLRQRFAPHNIVVAGDSAGGNFTLAMLMKLRDNGEPLPAAAACLSPAADLTGGRNASDAFFDPLLPARARRVYCKSYLGDNDPRDPLISPAFGDFSGLPPLLIHAGEDELLRDDAISVERLAKAAGVDVRLRIFPRMWHVWQVFLELQQAQESLDEIAGFLQSHLAPPREGLPLGSSSQPG